MNIAVVDLGSNTFHLLIVAPIDDTLQEIYRKRVYARLARSGIGLISDTAFQKGVDVLIEFKKEIDKHNVSRIKVVGTEMLRLAPNGGDFVRKVKEKTGFDIEIISGNQEAEYIFKGVEPLLPSGALLIMDIGGGSVEFIIVIDGKKKWLISLPIGIAVLYFDFQHSDPIQTPDLAVLEGFLAKKLKPLKNAIQRYPINELIGASGVFETFFDVLGTSKDSFIEKPDFSKKLETLILTTAEARESITAIPKMRKKMIVVASILLKSVLEQTTVERIRYSPNSLKEGVLYSMKH